MEQENVREIPFFAQNLLLESNQPSLLSFPFLTLCLKQKTIWFCSTLQKSRIERTTYHKLLQIYSKGMDEKVTNEVTNIFLSFLFLFLRLTFFYFYIFRTFRSKNALLWQIYPLVYDRKNFKVTSIQKKPIDVCFIYKL